MPGGSWGAPQCPCPYKGCQESNTRYSVALSQSSKGRARLEQERRALWGWRGDEQARLGSSGNPYGDRSFPPRGALYPEPHPWTPRVKKSSWGTSLKGDLYQKGQEPQRWPASPRQAANRDQGVSVLLPHCPASGGSVPPWPPAPALTPGALPLPEGWDRWGRGFPLT